MFAAFYLFDAGFSRSWRFTASYIKMLVFATTIGVLVQVAWGGQGKVAGLVGGEEGRKVFEGAEY